MSTVTVVLPSAPTHLLNSPDGSKVLAVLINKIVSNLAYTDEHERSVYELTMSSWAATISIGVNDSLMILSSTLCCHGRRGPMPRTGTQTSGNQEGQMKRVVTLFAAAAFSTVAGWGATIAIGYAAWDVTFPGNRVRWIL